ncbi:MAG: putative TIM-barrel fold metal-dependent hydrolase [Porticoccaceae bacterium]|jgi:predicted TIM-barrel fold metal-dependent hydrolase
MRRIDLHCYPNTQKWIDCQGPYVQPLADYWKRDWSAKKEEDVIQDFKDGGVEAVLVALDLSTTVNTPPCDNDYVAAMRDRHDCIIQAWGAVEPAMGQVAIDEAKHAINDLGMLGFHFHPIMQHFSVDDTRYYPLMEEISAMGVPVMIDVGMTGMGAGTPGGMGAKTRNAHPSSIDNLAADFPNLTIIMAHPGYPWIDETTTVALHKGNVYWEMSGWGPKYLPDSIKRDMRTRLRDKMMFGSDYPSIPYERLHREWSEMGFSDEVLEGFYSGNAERVLGL